MSGTFMLHLRTLLLTSLGLAFGVADATENATGDPNAAKGLVAEHCSKCHAVPNYSREGLPTVAAPSFQAIADNPDTYTEQRLRSFLRQPHWPMTQFRLSPSDIDNLLAYLKSLRAE